MTDVSKEKKTAPFDEILIREFLLDNPDFFNRYPELLLAMRIPHTERGTISLVERKQEMYRNRVQQLEEEITSLLGIASRNEMIYMFNTSLSLKLLQCEDLGELRQELSEGLKTQFQFSQVRLITVHDIDSELSQIWSKRLSQGYYFGRLTIGESKRLFGSEVGSVALSRLSEECGQVIFAIASQDSMHFHPEMDNLLLDQLKQLLDHLLPKL
ncbi:DUF484 family protein [Shewanella sp. D64]|uniref:DUF484 family protein n=1 Tax=unclassified Shewanella TaxID=196818 RepID=UPI0022BA2967|nr:MULTISPECIES: DUF484 family protein [unclassified Shewanella]MEC4726170.1 DUF484 family protein [Shewanella sp. D64]MEC4737914.1 DUF484 family protein [Shewanella sp. E94]WBJ96117.1 DUF484 family protein [Shewanella sp. MTB7]